jgi:hypothetical protein
VKTDGIRLVPRPVAVAFNTAWVWGWRPGPLVATFTRNQVPAVVIGGVAVSHYSRGAYVPSDLDILIPATDEAIGRAMTAVEEIATTQPLRTPLPQFDSARLRSGCSLVLQTETGTLDVVGYDLGVERALLVSRRRWVLIDRTWTPICRRVDLLAIKRYNPRHKDMEHIRLLTGDG